MEIEKYSEKLNDANDTNTQSELNLNLETKPKYTMNQPFLEKAMKALVDNVPHKGLPDIIFHGKSKAKAQDQINSRKKIAPSINSSCIISQDDLHCSKGSQKYDNNSNYQNYSALISVPYISMNSFNSIDSTNANCSTLCDQNLIYHQLEKLSKDLSINFEEGIDKLISQSIFDLVTKILLKSIEIRRLKNSYNFLKYTSNGKGTIFIENRKEKQFTFRGTNQINDEGIAIKSIDEVNNNNIVEKLANFHKFNQNAEIKKFLKSNKDHTIRTKNHKSKKVKPGLVFSFRQVFLRN